MDMRPLHERPDTCQITSYEDTHALGKRRLAAFLVKLAGRMHMVLGHARDDPDGGTHSNPTRHTWRFCQIEPCVNARILIEECGCSAFLIVLHEMGTRAHRSRQTRVRQKEVLVD